MHSPAPRRPRTTLLLALLWFAFLARGFWYCSLLPPWEGYDEPYHFAAVQNVAAGQGMPTAATPITLEVQQSLHLLPLPWMLHFHASPGSLTPQDDFWQLSPAEREQRLDAVRALGPATGSQPATEPILNYESQQTPLYYWVFAFPMRWMAALPLLSRIYLLRLLNMLLASAVVPLAYWIARRVLQSDTQAFGVTALIVLLPELMIHLARTANDSLALTLYTAMLAAAIQCVRKPQSWPAWLLLGATLGCGLLSKSYALSAVPGILAVPVACFWRTDDDDAPRPSYASIVARLAAAVALAAAIAGSWYLRVHRATGSWTGITSDSAQHHLSLLQKLAAATQVNWRSGFLSILISHVWFGAWSFLRVPDRLYKLAFLVIAAALGGVLVRLIRRRTPAAERRDILVLAVFYLGFWVGLLYHVLVTFLSLGSSSSTGWYLYAAVAAEVVLLVWGLQAFLPARIVFRALAICLGALDLYGTHALLMPYYTGLSSHVDGSVRPNLAAGLAHLPLIFDRLSQLHPAWLSAPVLWTWWAAYWAATLGVGFAVIARFRKPRSQR
jgi:4-amino-4-deoxy-L-arabinose transferase-like glycosyltransferase